MAYTKSDVMALVQELFRPPAGITNFPAQFIEFLRIVGLHEKEMTVDAKQLVDAMWADLFAHFDRRAAALPDGIDVRKARRMFALAGGSHLDARRLFNRLSNPSPTTIPGVVEAKDLCLRLVQSLLDVLYDTTKTHLTGIAQFSKVSLLYWSIDELLTALHLAQSKFPTQSYAHVRTLLEILDKLELFDKQPAWAAKWADDEQKDVWRELSQPEVRKKLGKKKWDSLSSHLSELGTHATFSGIQRRTSKSEVLDSEMPKFGLAVGPVRSHEAVIFANSVAIVAAGAAILGATVALKHRLNAEESIQVVREAIRAIDSHLDSYLLANSPQSRQDPKDVDVLLAKWKEVSDPQRLKIANPKS